MNAYVAFPAGELAADTLGGDFIPPEAVGALLGDFEYPPDYVEKYYKTMPSEKALQWCSDHEMWLIPGPPAPISVLDILRVRDSHFNLRRTDWCGNLGQNFSRDDKAEPGWFGLARPHLVEMGGKDWERQCSFLQPEMVVPNAAELLWCLTTISATNHYALPRGVFARTTSVDAERLRVIVGMSDNDSLLIYHYWDQLFFADLIVQPIRKF